MPKGGGVSPAFLLRYDRIWVEEGRGSLVLVGSSLVAMGNPKKEQEVDS